MLRLGYKLMSEEHGPKDLVNNAVRAERAGFDFAAISDHFFPWIEEQGHSPLAWPVLGAITNATHDQDYFLELFEKELAPALRHKKKVA